MSWVLDLHGICIVYMNANPLHCPCTSHVVFTADYDTTICNNHEAFCHTGLRQG